MSFDSMFIASKAKCFLLNSPYLDFAKLLGFKMTLLINHVQYDLSSLLSNLQNCNKLAVLSLYLISRFNDYQNGCLRSFLSQQCIREVLEAKPPRKVQAVAGWSKKRSTIHLDSPKSATT